MKGNRNTWVAFVAGIFAGAIVGILFAPDKGKNTRKKISDSAKKTADTLKDKIVEGKDAISEFAHRFTPFTKDIARGAGSEKYKHNDNG